MSFVHGINTRVFYNGAEISSFCHTIDWNAQGAVNETTTFGATGQAKTFIRGLNNATLTIGGYFDGTAGAIDQIFAAARTVTADDILTFAPAGTAIGTIVQAMQLRNTDYKVSSPVANVVALQANFQSDNQLSDPAFSLHDLTTETTTGTSTGVNNGAATSNGADANLHVTAVTGSWTIKVQHSSDNITYADLLTLNGGPVTTVGGYRASVPVGTTINQWTRDSHTLGTSITYHMNFGRR